MMLWTRFISTEIVIDAPISRVFETLANFDQYEQWNPFIIKGTGKATKVGQVVPIIIQLHGQKPSDYQVVIQEYTPPTCLKWLGHFKFPGLCNGNHTFLLRALDQHKTHLTHAERFTGLLVPFIWKSLGPRFQVSFDSLNTGLKEFIEK